MRISTNMTKVEFKGYCKGMYLHWTFKASDSPDNINYANKANYWDSVYDKYKHNCEG